MSIPKEPRQLMINLMYLVLTALLALNVSAEVMNAFFTLDKGNKESIKTVDSQLDQTVKGLKKLLEDESKAKFKPIEGAVEDVRSYVKDFNEYIDELRDELIDAAGTPDGEVNEKDYAISYGKKVPKGKKNKDITTRMLVDEGKGEELKARLIEAKDNMIKRYTDLFNKALAESEDNPKRAFDLTEDQIRQRIESMEKNMTLSIDDETWRNTKDKKSWADFKFRQMPLAAVLPLMSQMQSDAKSSEAALVNNMAELAGGRQIEFDAFFPVVSAKKAYVIKGEPFEAEISVGTYSTQINPEDIGIYVNGNKLTVNEEGKAEYKASTSSVGAKKLSLKARVRNPLTGKETEGDAEFTYEVGERSVTVSAEKMNVFYIGVDNPVAVSAAGVSSNDLKVSIDGGGGTITKQGSGSYNVKVTKPTQDCRIRVSAGPLKDQKQFRVKRIPDPVSSLNPTKKVDGGLMGNGEFKAQRGIFALLESFDFDAKCKISRFEMTRVARRSDPQSATNNGPAFNGEAKRLVQMAVPGDTYFIDEVRAQCPGDVATRRINSMVFKIK